MRVFALLALLAALWAPAVEARTWRILTASAAFSPRGGGVMEWYSGSTRRVGGGAITGPMLLMYGTGYWVRGSLAESQDVWASTNGIAWSAVSVVQPHDGMWSPQTVQNSLGWQFRIQGAFPDDGTSQKVWYSSDGGQNWKSYTASNLPAGRFLGAAVVDSVDNIYIITGQDVSGNLFNDVWKSTNSGRSWSRPTSRAVPWGARSVQGAVTVRYAAAQKDVIVVMFGYYGNAGGQNNYRNDVWASSDGAVNWVQMTARAAFPNRGDSQVEVTSSGVIVVVGGVTTRCSNDAGNAFLQLNDVWASVDGGYTFGLCNGEAEFSDRSFPFTALDKDGYLYIAGGTASGASLNDVWKSTQSFNDPVSVAETCNLILPTCGAGLSCWRTSSGFTQNTWGVGCDECPLLPVASKSNSEKSLGIALGIFVPLFVITALILLYTCNKVRSTGAPSPIPLPSPMQAWWNKNSGGHNSGISSLNEALKGDTNDNLYNPLTIRDSL